MPNDRFVTRFPCVVMPDHLGGRRAIILYCQKPPGADDNLVLATCVDIVGRTHGNVPFSAAAIRYAFEKNYVTLVEMHGSIAAPMAGLVGMDGRPLKS